MQTYGQVYHTYPIYSSDLGFEGSLKRYKTFPTPSDVYRKALLGLPKWFPLTKEPITEADAADYLEAAITEIEMSLNIDLSPVQHDQSFDYIDGNFEDNFSGQKLERWPATQIVNMALKFPHTQTVLPGLTAPNGAISAYQTYTIPPGWIALRRNRINVVAAYGSIAVQTGSPALNSAAGLFGYLGGFGRGAYQPAAIEVTYIAGFPPDQLPSSVWDLIITLAALRFLTDIAAPLFPTNTVSVTIDAVSQSASLPGPQLLIQKIDALKEQYKEKVNAITRHFGNTIKMNFIGA